VRSELLFRVTRRKGSVAFTAKFGAFARLKLPLLPMVMAA